MTFVSDSGTIITLARASKLHLLQNLFSQILIPNGVYEELVLKGKGKAGAEEVERGLFIKRERVTIKDSDLDLIGRIGQPDVEVIILAKEKKASVVLVDDPQVIRQVKEENIPFLTTIQILLLAKKRGFLVSVKEVMDKMRRQGVGIEDEDYEDALRQADEK